MSVEVRDNLTPELRRLSKKARDMSPSMRKIESRVMRPLRKKAWGESGLKSRSGELKGSVKTFSGKKSAGISVHKPPGRNLVMAKAVIHQEGRAAGSHRKKSRYRVRSYSRGGRRVSSHYRRNAGSPWGDIPAREFIPVSLGIAGQKAAVKIIGEHFGV